MTRRKGCSSALCSGSTYETAFGFRLSTFGAGVAGRVRRWEAARADERRAEALPGQMHLVPRRLRARALLGAEVARERRRDGGGQEGAAQQGGAGGDLAVPDRGCGRQGRGPPLVLLESKSPANSVDMG